MTEIGLIIPPDQPPERFVELAVTAEEVGLDEVWVWEDCFAEAGVAAAGALLASTRRVRVGIGLLPVPLRNVAVTAMEVATLARLFPGRLLPGIGHGVLDWMGQVGARASSPTTLLAEYTEALRTLLTGTEVSTDGRFVKLDRVQLRWPPSAPVPVLVGARGPRTLALAGAVGDGVILDSGDLDTVRPAVAAVRESRAGSGRSGEPEVVVLAGAPVGAGAQELADTVSGLAAVGVARVALFAATDTGAPHGGPEAAAFAAQLGRARQLLA